jgi:hypothetical protein
MSPNSKQNQAKRSRRILDHTASAQAAKDRRKLRRWVNRVINMTRYEVKAHGLIMNGNIDTHRRQMKKFRHITEWNVNSGRFK